ncbi:hypothetical protein [Aridibaculum aurantiacum]|uniref:hypothetical protein n=1 Tax=Aridibaculum aurantiacum TaxID=2810307 RepID=UPI001A975900|nr:hypothetical protein [Aridibaculum aurantiacum]
MTPRIHIGFLTIITSLTNFLYGQANVEEVLQVDTSKTTIISLAKSPKWFHPFDTTYKPAFLTNNDIKIIDSLLIVAVATYNNNLAPEEKNRSIELDKYNYRKQLFAASNGRGEKFVYVNCFCDTITEYWRNRWKTEVFVVADGGQCFFQFKVSLAKMTILKFGINGFG